MVGDMTYDVMGAGALDYLPCRYGTSKLMFRGPRRDLKEPYIAFMGGTETYGKFIETPFPALVEETLETTCVNFGQANAGIDVFTQDPFLLDAAKAAEVAVIQIIGAQNMTNRFYSVHPRRNDRFLYASDMLQTIYKEVDFADFHFTKHMLGELHSVSVDRFKMVQNELQQAWLARMRLMLKQIGTHVVLLWFSDKAVDDKETMLAEQIGSDPLFVTRDMLNELRPLVADIVEVVTSPEARTSGTDRMVFGELEEMAASEMLSPMAHDEAAEALTKAIQKMR